jgi:hypothetical protein
MRYSIAKNGLKEIQDTYLDYYKTLYDSVNLINNFTYSDDTVKNTLVLKEMYQIKDFWKQDSLTLKSSIYSYQINDKLKTYSALNGNRKAPLYLEYPLNIHHKFIVSFPETWNVNNTQTAINNEFFTYTSKIEYSNQTCYLDYNLQTLSDFVPVAKCKKFLEDIKQISEKHNGMEFTYSKSEFHSNKSSGGNSFALFFLFLIITGIFIGISSHFYKPKYPYFFEEPQEVRVGKTLDGWLIVFIIQMVLALIIAFVRLLSLIIHAPSDNGAYIIIQLVIFSANIIFPAFLLMLISKYDKRVPRFTSLFLLGNILLNILYYLTTPANQRLSYSAQSLGIIIIINCLWILYFQSSLRVKETFIK